MGQIPTNWIKQSGSFKIGEFQPTKGELVTNGTFSADTNWIKEGGWTISNGKASCNGSNGTFIYQLKSLTIGRRYKLTYEITNYISGILKPYFDSGTYVGTERSSTGVFTEYFTILSACAWVGLLSSGLNGSIDNVSITEISPLPTFKPGTKYLECVSAGTISIPSKQVYGTWEWDWYKASDASLIAIYLINDKNISYPYATGYQVQFSTGEEFCLYKLTQATVGVLGFSNAYCSNNTWYRVKVTRSISGTFTTFIKGGSFIPTVGYNGWTLVAVSSGLNPITDNTYTTSEYFTIVLSGVGNSIANIKLTDGIKARLDYGAELNADYAFNAVGALSLGAGWSVHDGRAYFNGDPWSLLQTSSTTISGKKYRITIDCYGINETLWTIYNGAAFTPSIALKNGSNVFDVTSNSNNSWVGLANVGAISDSGSFDNFSIKEIIEQ